MCLWRKEVLDKAHRRRNDPTDRQTDRRLPYKYYLEKLTGTGRYANLEQTFEGGQNAESLNELANLMNERMQSKDGGSNQRLAIMLGMLTKDQRIEASTSEKNRSQFAQTKWKFFLDAPFEISNRCCNVMKKSPAHKYTKETGRYFMTAQMVSESRIRTQKWVQNGCNGFDLKNPISNPMSFWFDDDVLLYLKINNVKIASVYGEIVNEDGTEFNPEEAMNSGIFDFERPCLRTTGCSRTGCMFCGYGCHLEKDGEGRFERLKVTHPKQYEYIMKPESEGGLGYKEKIDWINEHGNLHIKY